MQGCESECAGVGGIPWFKIKITFNCSKFLQYQISNSCLLKEIDPIFKIFKDL